MHVTTHNVIISSVRGFLHYPTSRIRIPTFLGLGSKQCPSLWKVCRDLGCLPAGESALKVLQASESALCYIFVLSLRIITVNSFLKSCQIGRKFLFGGSRCRSFASLTQHLTCIEKGKICKEPPLFARLISACKLSRRTVERAVIRHCQRKRQRILHTKCSM